MTSGIGAGVIILLSLWLLVLVVALISLRTERVIAVITIVVAVVITIIISLLPVESAHTAKLVSQEYDYMFMWRCLLSTFLGLCSVGSIAIYFMHHCTEPINTVLVQTWTTN